MDEAQFAKDVDTIDEIIVDEIFPILDGIEEDFPDQSAYYNAFINMMHVVFAQGWTEAELIQEVKDHHKIFLENENKPDTPLH